MAAVSRRPGIFLRILVLGLAVSLPPLGALGLAMIDVNADALRTSSRQLHLAIAADVRRAIRAEPPAPRRSSPASASSCSRPAWATTTSGSRSSAPR